MQTFKIYRVNRRYLFFAGTATLFGNHVFTFDGSYVIIPNASGKESCTYLLARDFRNASFTLLYSNNRLIIQSGHSKVTLSKAGKVRTIV